MQTYRFEFTTVSDAIAGQIAPEFHLALVPDLVQVKSFPLTMALLSTGEHVDPALTPANEGGVEPKVTANSAISVLKTSRRMRISTTSKIRTRAHESVLRLSG
jgi:hypothetical protein